MSPPRKRARLLEPDGQQPTQTPGVSRDSSQVAKEPVTRGGVQVFVDPATGQITQPTDAQLQQMDLQNRAANVSVGQSEVVVAERPSASVGGGMMADVPASLFPSVTAAIGADGKVTIEERHGQGGAKDAILKGSKVGQSAQSGVGQSVESAGDQSLRSEADQRLGPAGDQNLQLDLPDQPEVIVSIVNLDAAGEGFNDPTAVAPVFGNPGTTRGAQRLNAFRAAAEYWGGILKSRVPIRVDAHDGSSVLYRLVRSAR